MKRKQLVSRWELRDVVRTVNAAAYSAAPIRGPVDLVQYLEPYSREMVECLVLLALDSKMRIIGHAEVSRGTANSCVADVASVLRHALLTGCAAFILAHNHPSGDVSPSAEDIATTAQIARGATAIALPFLDHLIVGTTAAGMLVHNSAKSEGWL